MRLVAVSFACALAALFTAPTSCQAQIFRRVWERRKAEVRSELLGDLSSKMDADLAREVAAAQARLHAVAADQIRQQGETLTNEVREQVGALRHESIQTVNAEAKKIEGQMQAKVAEMAQQYEQQLAQLRAEHQEKLQAAAAKLQSDFEARSAEMVKSTEQRVAGVTDQLKADIAAAVEKLAQSNPPTAPETPAKPKEEPAPTAPPAPVTESKPGDGNSGDGSSGGDK